MDRLNGLMLIATPACESHYVVNVIAGVLIAAACWAAIMRLVAANADATRKHLAIGIRQRSCREGPSYRESLSLPDPCSQPCDRCAVERHAACVQCGRVFDFFRPPALARQR